MTTNVQLQRTVPGAHFSSLFNITLDNAYPNPAGYVFTPQSFNLSVLKRLLFNAFQTVAGAAYEVALVPTYNSDGVTLASVALHLVVGTTGVEVANGVNLSAIVLQLVAEGS